jgi:hypothetical protein
MNDFLERPGSFTLDISKHFLDLISGDGRRIHSVKVFLKGDLPSFDSPGL